MLVGMIGYVCEKVDVYGYEICIGLLWCGCFVFIFVKSLMSCVGILVVYVCKDVV